jgi:hypothetical protein
MKLAISAQPKSVGNANLGLFHGAGYRSPKTAIIVDAPTSDLELSHL